MNTILKVLSCFLILSVSSGIALAAPQQNEVDQLLTEMNWSMEELEDYLAFYELTLDDFETAEELSWMLGTPITEDNLTELLQTHGMTKEELQTLLGEFGESLDDYHFIEDLEISLDFYLNNEDIMFEAEDFLAQVGLTEDEVDTLFTHLLSIDETVLETEMENIFSRLEPYLAVEDPTQITTEQQEELYGIWEELLTAYHLKANFYLVDGTKTAISYQELTNLEALNGKGVLIELLDLQGSMLLDMQLSNEMLASDFLFEAGEEIVHVGEIAGELTNELHNAKLPNTASPYGFNIIIGIFVFLAGLTIYQFTKRVESV